MNDTLHGRGVCAGCGHDPACGFASVSIGDSEYWLCHTDDHSCYAPMMDVHADFAEHFRMTLDEARAAVRRAAGEVETR